MAFVVDIYGVCFQVEIMQDSEGRRYIAGDSMGSFCKIVCENSSFFSLLLI